MKKYTLMIVLCLTLVVGGVFATWSYADQPIAPKEVQPTFELETYSQTSEGTITFEGTVSFKIDQADADYKAKLVANTNNLKLSYEADPNSTKDPNLEWLITGTFEVDGKAIITANETPVSLGAASSLANTIESSALLEKLPITLTLANITDYNTFNTNFGDATNNLKLIVREAV